MQNNLASFDPQVAEAVRKELDRQEYKLELIASENFVSKRVLEAMGQVMTNKYAEGYPHKRYYGGCEFVDEVEELAIERAKRLFGCDGANVQPHSGSQANMAVYFSVLQPGDLIMGMDLSQGGHLSHGSPVNFTGKLFKIVSYGVDSKTELIDFNVVREIAKKNKPKMIVCGASAYARDINFKEFRSIADEVEAYVLADIAHPAGLVATGLHTSPIPHCQFVTTTTHKTLRGPRGGMVMFKKDFEKAVNKTVFPGIQGGPLMHVIAAKAVAFLEDLEPGYKNYCEQIVKNSRKLSATLAGNGFRIVTGGTDTHLFLVDLTEIGITGKEAEDALGQAGITVNKNTIPRETRSPFITSGIRIGTPALTTRGMKEPEMKTIGSWISSVLKDVKNEDLQRKVKTDIRSLCEKFPLYR